MSNERQARLVWQGQELDFAVTTHSGFEFTFGSPASQTKGSPMDFFLAAVAGCTALDVLSILQKMRQPVTGFAVEIQGTRAEEYPKVFTEAVIVYIVRGQGISPDAVERAIALSQETYCSASIMFKRAGAGLQTSYRLEEG